jgi:hypothetical protein
MDQLIPSVDLQGLFQNFSPLKAQIAPTSDVYTFSANIVNPLFITPGQTMVSSQSVTKYKSKDLSKTVKSMGGNDVGISGMYNNSSVVNNFDMKISASLGLNDCLAILQFNDVKPNIQQVLFVQNQEIQLIEAIKVSLKPNDGIVILVGKTDINDNSHVSVRVMIGDTYRISEMRKLIFAALMIILLVAILVLIYTLMNQATNGASFRRRRR